MKKLKNVASFIISLLLTFVFLANIFLVFFKNTILNIGLYTEALENNKGVESIYESINDNINYLMLSNNIPQDTMKDIITIEEIQDEVNSTMITMVSFILGMDSKESSLNTEPYLAKFDEKMDNFISENSIIMTEDLKNDIKSIRASVNTILTSELQIVDLNKFINSSVGNKIKNVLNILNGKTFSIALFSVDIILIALIALIWGKRRIYRTFAWVGYSAIASGLIIFLVSLSGYISKFYDSLIIGIPYLKNFIITILKHYLKSLCVNSLFFILLGIIFITVYFIHYTKQLKKYN